MLIMIMIITMKTTFKMLEKKLFLDPIILYQQNRFHIMKGVRHRGLK